MPDKNQLWLVRCKRYVWVLADSEQDARDKAISDLNTLSGAHYYSIDDPEQLTVDIDGDHPAAKALNGKSDTDAP